MTRLREHDWQDSFTSSQNNLLLGFYQPVLQQAIRYWRITGYFSSRSLLQVLDGVEQLVLAQGQPVELLPRSPRVRRLQAELAAHYQLASAEFGSGNQQRLRIFPR